MSLPTNLKNFNVFADAVSLMGVAEELKLPKLSRKMEDYQGGGMPAPIEIDLGNEKIEAEFTMRGFTYGLLQQYGAPKANAVLLRFAGAYQSEDTGVTDAVEVVMRGRYKEIDPGSQKIGDKTTTTVKIPCTYYKLTVNGKELIEIDALACIFKVNGVDMLAEQRKAIGLA